MEKEYNLKIIGNEDESIIDLQALITEMELNGKNELRFHIFAKENLIKKVEDEKPPYNTEVIGYNKEWIDPDYNREGTCICFMYDDPDNTWFISRWCGYHDEWHSLSTDTSDNVLTAPDEYGVDNKISPPTHWTYKPKFE